MQRRNARKNSTHLSCILLHRNRTAIHSAETESIEDHIQEGQRNVSCQSFTPEQCISAKRLPSGIAHHVELQ